MQNYTYQCLMNFEVSVNPDLIERIHGGVILDVEVPPEAGRPIRTNPKGSWNSNRRFLRMNLKGFTEGAPQKAQVLFEANISKDALAQVGVFGGVASSVMAKTRAVARFLFQAGIGVYKFMHCIQKVSRLR